MSVRRFLVTGPDENLQRFHLRVCFQLNALERRGSTCFYTAFDEDAAHALTAAERVDVSVQEIEGAGLTESYTTLRTGSHGMLWTRRES